MKKYALLATALLALGTSAARGALIVEVFRLSDSLAQISSVGTVDENGPFESLLLVGASSVGDAGLDAFAGDFEMDGASPQSVFTQAGTLNFAINLFSFPFGAGSTATGVMTATLDVETWAAVGTTGIVLGAAPPGAADREIGRYSIIGIPVPEPATLALVFVGLSALGLARSKRIV